MLDEGELTRLAENWVQCARHAGAQRAEALVRSESELSVRVGGGEVDLVRESGQLSLSLRVRVGDKSAGVATNDLSMRSRDGLIREALELARLVEVEEELGEGDDEGTSAGADSVELGLYQSEVVAFNVDDALAAAALVDAASRAADPRIQSTRGATVTRKAGVFALALSSGLCRVHRSAALIIQASAVATGSAGPRQAGSWFDVTRRLPTSEQLTELGNHAATRAVRRLGTRRIPSGRLAVVFSPSAVRSLFTHVAGAVLGDSVLQHQSIFAGRLSSAVASPALSIHDDPFVPSGVGSRAFDGEGAACQRTVVMEQGVLRSLLCDRRSALKLGQPYTASAARSARGGVHCSVSNFVVQPGEHDEAQLVRDAHDGLYVSELLGTTFNRSTGMFSSGISGFRIQGGECAFPVGGVVLSAHLDELLHGVQQVGRTLDRRGAIVCPALQFGKVTIAGATSAAAPRAIIQADTLGG